MNVIIGRYVPSNSVIHRMDPRAKLLTMFIYAASVFFANSSVTYAMSTVFLFILLLLLRVPFSFIMKGLRPVLWIVLFTFFLHAFLTKEGALLYQIGELAIYEGGLRKGVFISLRFLLLIVITTWLTISTTPVEVTDAVESIFGPLKRFRVPVHELALMMSISLRFIPTLMEETEKIMKAQAARGVDFYGGPFGERMKAITSLLIPLFIHAFKRAEELAIAMEARGYRGGEGRTKYRLLTWGWIDTWLLASTVGMTIVLLLFRT
ncbi:energy-coupling factor transporter transmembrane component T family protein [Anoxybacteroides amylolyticum]|uniref:Energy-coupling factor transporter transmembrane protein EcfT n=1 Tax=Anoxybacteroides amylolyticum TaxID=294699 RepID=A0A160F2N9_9BACL|nr:energy-coupling factor transporter transmembrane protein EcfT [Anoxybacillus amylolyticus]ANB60012.1 cobalt transport family protein [Anoxybacillus amylolyticus]